MDGDNTEGLLVDKIIKMIEKRVNYAKNDKTFS